MPLPNLSRSQRSDLARRLADDSKAIEAFVRGEFNAIALIETLSEPANLLRGKLVEAPPATISLIGLLARATLIRAVLGLSAETIPITPATDPTEAELEELTRPDDEGDPDGR